ncbi:MAG: CRISPR-associated endoribonuclease Cas6, partial [Endomicrobiia bacterium]
MRLKITLQTDVIKAIPINYQYFLSSTIYNLLATSNLDFATALHDGKHLKSPKKFKWFTFSWFQIPASQRVISNSIMKILPGQFNWFITSPWKKFIQYLVNGLLEL